MQDFLLKKENILALFETFKETLSMQVPLEDYDGLMNHLQELVSLLSSSVEVQTSAGYLLNEKKRSVMERREQMTATIFREYLKGECSEEEAIYEMATRFNAALTHGIETYRSILSACKEDKKLSKYATT